MEEGERVVKEQQQHTEEEEEERERKGNRKYEEEVEEIWSWGAGTEGQLGTGKLQDEHSPQLLLNLSDSLSSFGSVSLLACGGAHVIALSSCGKVMSWGRGASGQLGHGEIVPNCLYPKLVDSLAGFYITHVSAGWNHSGFVSDSGCLFTCGDGSFGQLGHGDYQSYSSPLEVSFFRSKHVEQMACGLRHSLVLLKGDSGEQVYGFGSGKRGQLGVSKDKVRSLSLPQPCSGLEDVEIGHIIANGDHSAALSANGQLYTWGRGFSSGSDVCVPQPLPASLRFKQVALGWNHALVLTGEGEVLMLGGTRHGVLSEPQQAPLVYNSPDLGEPNLSKVPGPEGKKIVQIAAGAEHSAIVTEDGQICTWGWGEHGQLGLGNTSDQTLPQVVDLGDEPVTSHLTTEVYCGSGFVVAVKTSTTSDSYLHKV